MPLTVMVWTLTGEVPLRKTRLRLVLKLFVPVRLKFAATVLSWVMRKARRWLIQLLMADGLFNGRPLAWKAAYLASRTASMGVPAPVWKNPLTPSERAH